jgi:hypothetical protein
LFNNNKRSLARLLRCDLFRSKIVFPYFLFLIDFAPISGILRPALRAFLLFAFFVMPFAPAFPFLTGPVFHHFRHCNLFV